MLDFLPSLDSFFTVLEWVIFFIIMFALIGVLVRFYLMFNVNNFIYYQPKIKEKVNQKKFKSKNNSSKLSVNSDVNSELAKKIKPAKIKSNSKTKDVAQ